MNLLDLTEPLFQYVCRLNRVARKSASIDHQTVRSNIRDLFATMAEKAENDPALAQQYQKIEAPLTYFVDSVISESRLEFALEWNQNRLAFERQELAGDERFFDLLDETLAEKSEAASERLAVFYTCLGLGFSGWFAGQHEMLRRKMVEIAPRIRGLVESDDTALICPDAYEHTNTADLPLPVGTRLIGIGIIFFGLTFVVVAANFFLFQTSSTELYRALGEITKHDPAASAGQR